MTYSFDNELGAGVRHIGDILEEMLISHSNSDRSANCEEGELDIFPGRTHQKTHLAVCDGASVIWSFTRMPRRFETQS